MIISCRVKRRSGQGSGSVSVKSRAIGQVTCLQHSSCVIRILSRICMDYSELLAHCRWPCTAECDTANSTLKLIKTVLCNSTGDDWLSSLHGHARWKSMEPSTSVWTSSQRGSPLQNAGGLSAHLASETRTESKIELVQSIIIWQSSPTVITEWLVKHKLLPQNMTGPYIMTKRKVGIQ